MSSQSASRESSKNIGMSKLTNSNSSGEQVEELKEDFQKMIHEVGDAVHKYCKERPQMAGLMIFAAGFYVGWKIKPW